MFNQIFVIMPIYYPKYATRRNNRSSNIIKKAHIVITYATLM